MGVRLQNPAPLPLPPALFLPCSREGCGDRRSAGGAPQEVSTLPFELVVLCRQVAALIASGVLHAAPAGIPSGTSPWAAPAPPRRGRWYHCRRVKANASTCRVVLPPPTLPLPPPAGTRTACAPSCLPRRSTPPGWWIRCVRRANCLVEAARCRAHAAPPQEACGCCAGARHLCLTWLQERRKLCMIYDASHPLCCPAHPRPPWPTLAPRAPPSRHRTWATRGTSGTSP